MNFKLIKSKEFTFKDEKGVDIKGVVHTVAHKGRVFNLSSLNFEAKELAVEKGVLSVKCDIDIVRENYTNALGESVVGLKIIPKMDLVLSAF